MYHAGTGSAFTASGAFAIVCAAAASLIVGAVIAVSVGAVEMAVAVVSQLCMLAVPIIAMRRSGRPVAALGLTRPAARYLLAAVLIGVSAWYLNMLLVEVLPLPDTDERLVALIDRPSLPVVLLAIAVTPAICEEILFRGVLVRGLATRLHAGPAIVLAAALFAAYHLRVVQLAPTFTLGLVFGLVTLRSGSAIPTMLAHFLNNAIALVIARDDMPALTAALADNEIAAGVGAAALTILGIAITLRDREGRR